VQTIVISRFPCAPPPPVVVTARIAEDGQAVLKVANIEDLLRAKFTSRRRSSCNSLTTLHASVKETNRGPNSNHELSGP
jgi:hypothetical protein